MIPSTPAPSTPAQPQPIVVPASVVLLATPANLLAGAVIGMAAGWLIGKIVPCRKG